MKRKPLAICLLLLMSLHGVPIVPAHAAETIRLSTLEWEPYIGSPPVGKGYVAELVRAAYAVAGYEVELTFLPWARAVATAKNGEYDGYLPEYYAQRLEADFLLSHPFPCGPLVFFKRRGDRITYTRLEDLEPYTIGVVRGYVNTQAFDRADFLKKDPVANDRLNFLKLINRRIDLVVADKFVGRYILSSDLPGHANDIEVMDPPLEEKTLHICITRSAPAAKIKLDAFNNGLERLRQNGRLERLLHRHGLHR